MNFFFFLLAKSDDNTTLVDFSVPALKVFWSFVLIYFYCNLGEMVAAQFNKFDDELCKCNWYLFPIEAKRIFLIFICETQQLTLFRGYGNIECTRQAFEQVIYLFVFLF